MKRKYPKRKRKKKYKDYTTNKYPIKWFKITFALKEDFPNKEWFEKSILTTVTNLVNLHLTGAINPLTKSVKFAMENPANQLMVNGMSIKTAKDMTEETKKRITIDWDED